MTLNNHEANGEICANMDETGRARSGEVDVGDFSWLNELAIWVDD